MNRFILPTLLSALLIISLLNIEASIETGSSNTCLKCHEKISLKYEANLFRHHVVKENCTLCHARDDGKKLETTLRFSSPMKSRILYLGDLEENKRYEAEVMLTDSKGRSSAPQMLSITLEDLWNYDKRFSSLNEISRVRVEEIKKGGFVNATISWNTDDYATSEIEFREGGEYGRRFSLDNQFTKEHKVELTGLKHTRKYSYKVISRDMSGKSVQSNQYNFNTSTDIPGVKKPGTEGDEPPSINTISMFRVGKEKAVYLKVTANKPSETLVRLREIRDAGEMHGSEFSPERFATIEACRKCHPQNASHPVGIRARSPDIITPDELPTIEDGVITCVTCHDPHGGDTKYFARMDYKRDLCIKCHIGGY